MPGLGESTKIRALQQSSDKVIQLLLRHRRVISIPICVPVEIHENWLGQAIANNPSELGIAIRRCECK